MSDRKLIGFLLLIFGGGIMFFSMTSDRFAFAVTAYIERLLGLGNFTSALIAVFGLMSMIFTGLWWFFKRRS